MSVQENKLSKYHRIFVTIALVLMVFVAAYFRQLSSILTPILFLIVVLVALHSTRKLTLMTIVLISILSYIVQDPNTSFNDYLGLWGMRSVGFLLVGLIINYEVENMRKIQRYTEEKDALSSISYSLTSTLDLKELTERVIDKLIEHFSADGCTIYFLEEETRELHPIACRETDIDINILEKIMETRVRVGFGLIGWVAATGEPILSGDAERDNRAIHIPGTPFDNESIIAVPLQTEGKPFGVLYINKLELNAFDESDLQLAQIFANQFSIALANAQLYENVRRLSETDSLTGLLNSRTLSHIANHYISKAQEDNSSVTVLFIDCDDFKSINDQFGHPVGDKFLQFFAKILLKAVRENDIVFRYAGDEFVIILPSTDLPKAKIVAQRLMEDIRNHRMGDIPGLSTTVSVGLAVYPEHASTADELIKHADEALYVVKHHGKDQLAVYLEGVVGA